MSQRLEVVNPKAPPPVWAALRNEAYAAAKNEAALASLLAAVILNHDTLGDALSYQLARKLGDQELRAMSLRDTIEEAYEGDPSLVEIAEADLKAVFERDPACKGYVQPFLFFKGFLALQTHRVAHWLYGEGRHGRGAGGGDQVQRAGVGADRQHRTGAEQGDRHPKVGKGVLLGAGAKVLGNIKIGDYAKVASGSVVLKDVPAGCTAAGVPARLVNCPTCEEPARSMDHTLAEAVYDYVI